MDGKRANKTTNQARKAEPAKSKARRSAARSKGGSRKVMAKSAPKGRVASRGASASTHGSSGARDSKNGVAKAKRRRVFMRALIPDFFLTFVVCLSLVLTVEYCFVSTDALRLNVGMVSALVLPLLIALFAGTWSKRAVAISAVATTCISAAIIAVSVFLSANDADALADVPGNYVIFAFTVIVPTIVAFLMSRRLVSGVLLFIVGIFACGLVQFLYEGWLVLEMAAFLIAMLALVVYKVYQNSVYEAETVRKTTFAGAAAFAAVMAAAFAMVGVGIYAGVVAPMDPQAQELKLLQERFALEVVYYTGIYDASQHPDEDNTTDDTNDERRETDDDVEGDRQDEGEKEDGNLQAANPFSISTVLQDMAALNYEQLQLLMVGVLLLLAAIVVGAVFFRRSMRARRLRKIAEQPPGYRVAWIYDFLEQRLARLGFKRPEAMTPAEYAAVQRRKMLAFAEHCDSDWSRVTDIYYKGYYGAGVVSDAEAGEVEDFYRAFFRNAREYSGWFKWIWRFWRI